MFAKIYHLTAFNGYVMPIFEYVCDDCHSSFETLVMGSAEPECPSCHGKRLEQKFSVFSATVASHPSAKPAPMGGCCGGGACGFPGSGCEN